MNKRTHFVSLQRHLERTLAIPSKMCRLIDDAFPPGTKKKERETEFVVGRVIPEVFAWLVSADCGLDPTQARQAILAENYRNKRIKELVRNSKVARADAHPFNKTLGLSAEKVFSRWREGHGKKIGTTQPYPDFAVTTPGPFRAVFEVKYFRSGDINTAKRALVAGLYECFFYLAMPRSPPRNGYPAWEYDYACFLAYDATPAGLLIQAWDELPDKMQESFWSGANIYPMILRRRTQSDTGP